MASKHKPRCGCGGELRAESFPWILDKTHMGRVSCTHCNIVMLCRASDTPTDAITAVWDAYWRAMGWRRPEETPTEQGWYVVWLCDPTDGELCWDRALWGEAGWDVSCAHERVVARRTVELPPWAKEKSEA